jgi:hypothetical protein
LPIAIGEAGGGPVLILIGEAMRARRAADLDMILDAARRHV